MNLKKQQTSSNWGKTEIHFIFLTGINWEISNKFSQLELALIYGELVPLLIFNSSFSIFEIYKIINN